MGRTLTGAAVVFWGGFAIMVLEIVGARFLARDFGSSFYVWTSQIGVILVALALGYAVGGALADRYGRGRFLVFLLVPAGLLVFLLPSYAGGLIEVIVSRHPLDRPIPQVWQKLDPALGSALIFLFPCFALATLSPAVIRLASRQLGQVGRVSGLVYACSTAGSIAGVFMSGYVLIDWLPLSTLFRVTGVLTLGLAAVCWGMDRWGRDSGGEGAS